MILAAMLIPVFQQARAQARKSSCINQMRQFGQAIVSYRGDTEELMPRWMSSLYPDYMPSTDVYVCPQDPSAGFDGGRHGLGFGNGNDSLADVSFSEGDEYGDPSIPGLDLKDIFAETDDTSRNPARVGEGANLEIERSSYMYEFADVQCSWLPTSNMDWYDIKPEQLRQGLGRNGAQDFTNFLNGIDDDLEAWEPYQFPMIRCFQHMGVLWGKREMAINSAYSGEFFYSKYEWEKTFQ